MAKFKNPQYIPDAPAYLSREVFLQILNIPRTTFYRQLRKQGIKIPPGLLSPKTQNFICEQLGFPKLWPEFT